MAKRSYRQQKKLIKKRMALADKFLQGNPLSSSYANMWREAYKELARLKQSKRLS